MHGESRDYRNILRHRQLYKRFAPISFFGPNFFQVRSPKFEPVGGVLGGFWRGSSWLWLCFALHTMRRTARRNLFECCMSRLRPFCFAFVLHFAVCSCAIFPQMQRCQRSTFHLLCILYVHWL